MGSLPTKSWIAVADDSNGDIGYILGAQRLPAGVYQNVTVELLRDTVSEMPYHVVVFEDDGDDIFNHKSDILITLSDGSLLVSDFVAN